MMDEVQLERNWAKELQKQKLTHNKYIKHRDSLDDELGLLKRKITMQIEKKDIEAIKSTAEQIIRVRANQYVLDLRAQPHELARAARNAWITRYFKECNNFFKSIDSMLVQ